MATPLKQYTLDEVKEHATEKSCWFVYQGKVYDVTDFLEEHPGNPQVILDSAGRDATSDFDVIGHSNSAKKLLADYLIGEVQGGAEAAKEDSKSAKAAATATATQPKEVSTFTRIFNVLLPLIVLALGIFVNQYFVRKK